MAFNKRNDNRSFGRSSDRRSDNRSFGRSDDRFSRNSNSDRRSNDRSGNKRPNNDRNFSRGSTGKGFMRDTISRNTKRLEMHRVTCDSCGTRCEVPFRPTAGKPVLCSECFEDKNSTKTAPQKDYSNELKEINQKLDKILKALSLL